MKDLTYNKEKTMFSIPVGHGYTFHYNHKTFVQYIQKDNGDVVSSFAWVDGLTVSEFVEQINQAKIYAESVANVFTDILSSIKTVYTVGQS